MRVKMVILASSTLTAALLGAGELLAGQHDSSAHDTAVCQTAHDREVMTQSVVGKPFIAETLTVWTPSDGRPELRATARYLRDSTGRVRVEQTFAGRTSEPQRIIINADANDKWAYSLDPVARTSTRIGRGIAQMIVGGGGCDAFALPLTPRRSISFFIYGPQDENIGESESLGTRQFAGIEAIGTAFTMGLSRNEWAGRGERWVSPELNLVVATHAENPKLGTFDFRLEKMSRSEPSAELFEVPQDYVPVPGGALCFGNPYNATPCDPR